MRSCDLTTVEEIELLTIWFGVSFLTAAHYSLQVTEVLYWVLFMKKIRVRP